MAAARRHAVAGVSRPRRVSLSATARHSESHMRMLALSALGVLASAAGAQELTRQVRFIGGSPSGGVQQWQGYIERLTPDSLYLRVRGTDSVAAFLRTGISSVERERSVSLAAGAGVGCLAVGVPLGALGYFGTHDPDSPGIEKVAGVLGFAVG